MSFEPRYSETATLSWNHDTAMGSSQNSLVKDVTPFERNLIFPILGFLYNIGQSFPKQVGKTS